MEITSFSRKKGLGIHDVMCCTTKNADNSFRTLKILNKVILKGIDETPRSEEVISLSANKFPLIKRK